MLAVIVVAVIVSTFSLVSSTPVGQSGRCSVTVKWPFLVNIYFLLTFMVSCTVDFF